MEDEKTMERKGGASLAEATWVRVLISVRVVLAMIPEMDHPKRFA